MTAGRTDAMTGKTGGRTGVTVADHEFQQAEAAALS